MHRSFSAITKHVSDYPTIGNVPIARDEKGILHAVVVFMRRYGQYAQLGYTYSKDDGKTWAPVEALTADDTTSDTYMYSQGEQAILVTPTYIHILSRRLSTDFTIIRHFYKNRSTGTWSMTSLGNNPTTNEAGSSLNHIIENEQLVVYYGQQHLRGVWKGTWYNSTGIWTVGQQTFIPTNKDYDYGKHSVYNNNHYGLIQEFTTNPPQYYLINFTTQSNKVIQTGNTTRLVDILASNGYIWVTTQITAWSWSSGIYVYKFNPSNFNDYTQFTYVENVYGHGFIQTPQNDVLLYYSDSTQKLRGKIYKPSSTIIDTQLNINHKAPNPCGHKDSMLVFPAARRQLQYHYYPNKLDLSLTANGCLYTYFKMRQSANSYLFVDLTSVTDYTFSSSNGTNQYLEYEIYYDSTEEQKVAFDLEDGYGIALRDDGTAVDQNGIQAHPDRSLEGRACKKWYYRKIKIPESWITSGKTITRFCVACEKNDTSDTEVFFRNIRLIKEDGTILKTIYNKGGVASHSVYISNEYTTYTIREACQSLFFSKFLDTKREFPVEYCCNVGPTKWQRQRQFPK